MKPIVIYVDKQKNNITLTREEFEDFINKAYEQGYSCGYVDGKRNSTWWPYGSGGVTYSNTPNTTGTPSKLNPYEITCANTKNSIFASGNKVTATNSIYTDSKSDTSPYIRPITYDTAKDVNISCAN